MNVTFRVNGVEHTLDVEPRLLLVQALREELDLTGTHPDFGPVTLRQLLATWAVHDLNHIQQIVRTLSNEYREAVGPWQAYLSILQ